MHKTSGFSPIAIIITIATIAILALVGWRIFDFAQNSQTTQNSQTNASQQEEAQEQNNDTQTIQTDPNEGYVVIKEWNVRFKPVDGLSGVEYFRPSDFSTDAYTFTTKELAAASPNCASSADNIIMGVLSRNTQETFGYGGLQAHIGDYYYQYMGPQAACSDGLAEESRVLLQISQSLKSLEEAK